jgi:hypothetical protein
MPLSSVVGAQSIVKPGVCTSSTRPASPYDGQVIYETDTDIAAVWDGSGWVNLGATGRIAIFNETQTAGTEGGGFTSGAWTKRTLNTTAVNYISGCSIASSVMTLATAGTYHFSATAPAFQVNGHQLVLQNTTASTQAIIGPAMYTASTDAVQTRAMLEGVVTITGSTNFELQHRCTATKSGNGLGAAQNITSEIYSIVRIQRLK